MYGSCNKWLSLSPQRVVFHYIILSCNFALASHIVPKAYSWVISRACDKNWSLNCNIDSWNCTRMKTFTNKLKLNFLWSVFIQSYWFDLNNSNVIILQWHSKNIFINTDRHSKYFLVFGCRRLPLSYKIECIFAWCWVVFFTSNPHRHFSKLWANEKAFRKLTNANDTTVIFVWVEGIFIFFL